MFVKEIEEYVVQYSSNQFPPRIWLKAKGQYLGTQLVFKSNGTVLPPDTQTSIYYHLDDFQNIIDILRNEKPVFLSWVGPNSENGIRTSPEAIGEEED